MAEQDEHPHPTPEAIARMAAFEAACDLARLQLEQENHTRGWVKPAVYPGGSLTPPGVVPPMPDPPVLPVVAPVVAITDEATVLALPGDHYWRVALSPDPVRFARWRELLTTEGASLASWHELLAAYDLGWTLLVPSPADMPDVSSWSDVPLAVAQTIVDWMAREVAGVLAAQQEVDAAA